jgi:zinc-ribbon domain
MYCSQCGKGIEQDSKFCRFCGAAQLAEPVVEAEAASGGPADISPGKILTGGVAAVLLIVVLVALLQSPKPAAPQAALNLVDVATDNAEDMTAVADVTPASTPTPESSWSYSSDEDKVRGGTSYFARATSTNEVQLAAPYDGGSSLGMTVRKSPAYGTDVMLVLSSGQLMCPSYEGCYGTVRFDSGPAERVALSGAADNSSDTVFIDGAADFIAKLKKAHKVIVELEIYQGGRPQFEFDVKGLNWAH